MKILMLSHFFDDHRGGIEIVAGELAKELALQDIPITWMATGSAPSTTFSGLLNFTGLHATNFVERLTGIPYPLLSPGAIWQIFRAACRSDVIIAHDALYLPTLAGFLAARLTGKPFAIIQHVGFVPYSSAVPRIMFRIANRMIGRRVLRGADQVIFISELTRSHFADIKWKRSPRMIFNGVNVDIFRPPSSEAETFEARQSFGLSQSQAIVLFVGRFVEKKGLSIMRALAMQNKNITFAFAGWGLMNPTQWNLPNVRVFTSLSRSNLAELYRASTLLVLPSVGEGLPLVIQEALACGMPVICGQDTVRADPAARPFLTGIPIDQGNPAATAQLISREVHRLLDGSKAALAQQDRAAFARMNYSWPKAAQQYVSVLRSLLSTPRTVLGS